MKILPVLFLIFAIFLGSGFLQPLFAVTEDVTVSGAVPGCGDGVIQIGEECDGSNVNGQSCTGKGFFSGALSCNSNCTLNTSACVSAPPPSGGGGGGIIGAAVAKVTIFGQAYPYATIFLLKGAQIAVTAIADAQGNFEISYSGPSAGDYIFSLYAKDTDGRASRLRLFPLTLTKNTTLFVKEVVVAPTLGADKQEVQRGERIIVSGHTFPGSDVLLTIGGVQTEFSGGTISGVDGKYQYVLDTSSLEYEEYRVQAQATFATGALSDLSGFAHFRVGTRTVVPVGPSVCPSKGDLNGDCRVNLVDFSILIYWFGKPNPPVQVNLDGNGIVDVVDFSIMAFYWTG